MRPKVSNDLNASAAAFKDIVWPRLARFFDDGELIPVECVSAQGFERNLDTMAGIDAWHIQPHQQRIFGIASRMQPVIEGACGYALQPLPYNTFTIRTGRRSGAKTEYDKRLSSIADGSLYPAWTVQGFYSNPSRRFLSAMACRTEPLFRLAQTCIDSAQHDGHRYVKQDTVRGCGWGLGAADNADFIWLSFAFVSEHIAGEQWHQEISLESSATRGHWLARLQQDAA